ncbi:aldo/keto reductase [Pleionea sediminis]|uniref:aldo/keto reductase n=1 Tax=Pleionea sediminis TaxID=2569479 RepID=UPI00197BD309|nr:aldo/keto reductase [Pleionea sediminis]
MNSMTIKNDQLEMPLVGFGTFYIANEDAETTVSQALEAGYRHIDTAQVYGNEVGVGNAIQKAFKNNLLKREELFVTTKVWPGNIAWEDPEKNYDDTVMALNESLEKLQLDYVDLYLIHAPFAKERLAQWQALVDLKESGKIKHIGVSNYNEQHFEEIKAAGLPLPEVNQIELHPWSQKTELRSYMKSNSILPIAYSSLAPLSSWRTATGQQSSKTDQMAAQGEKDNQLFSSIAANHNVSEAQVLLRWAVQLEVPVIPKSVQIERMKKNIDLFSFSLTKQEMEELNALNKGRGLAWQYGDPIEFQ